ncbi:MAG: hypothetical protein AAF748_15395 [Pseudomonadota bacterium]
MRLRAAVILLCLAAQQGHAGAWPRGEGNTFVALSYTLNADPGSLGDLAVETNGFGALFVERGITDRLTFGTDVTVAHGGDYNAFFYFSRAIGSLDAPNRYAFHAGGGYVEDGATVDEPQAYIGASWGRGLETRWGSGWSAVDVSLFYRTDSNNVATKADLTLGVNLSEDWTAFVQAQSGKFPDNDAFLRLVPSVAFDIGQGRRLEVGVPIGVFGDGDIGIKFGTWLEF